jgi:hypothetical protein
VDHSSLCHPFAYPGAGFGTSGKAQPRVGPEEAVIHSESSNSIARRLVSTGNSGYIADKWLWMWQSGTFWTLIGGKRLCFSASSRLG